MVTLSQSKPKARKKHKCNYCGRAIEIGEVYNRSSHVYDGTCYTWKSHLLCDEISGKLKMFDHCDEGLTEDDFVTHIQEYYSDQYRDEPARSFAEKLDFLIEKLITLTGEDKRK